MMAWTEFDPRTGRIYFYVVGVQVVPPEPTDTRDRLDDVIGDKLTQYVSGGALVTRPPTSITATQAGAVVTLAGVAPGTVVRIGGAGDSLITQDAADGGMQFTFTHPGVYSLSAEQFPELPFNLEVTVS